MQLHTTIDKCAIKLAIFIITYLLLRHLSLTTFEQLLASVIITLSIVFLTNCILGNSKQNVPDEVIDRIMSTLALDGEQALIDTLANNLNVTSLKNHFITKGKTLVTAKLYNKISSEQISAIIRLANAKLCKRVAVYAPYGVDSFSLAIIQESDLAVKIIDARSLYNTLDNFDALPILKDKKKKKTIGHLIALLFARNNARRYLFTAIIIFIFSYFTAFAVWYILFAVLNLVFAIISLTSISERFI